MTAKFVRPAFFADAHARRLLDRGPAFINVYYNSFGDQFFGGAHSRRALADEAPGRRNKPLYRIVVRLKK